MRKVDDALRAWRRRIPDGLVRNVLLCAAVMMCAALTRGMGDGELVRAVGALVREEWDESLGRLIFVDNLSPDTLYVFSSGVSGELRAPVSGRVTHAFSESEPYLGFEGGAQTVRAADAGEVMSVSHGEDEERIVRVRGASGMELIYGSLMTAYVREGDRVAAGDPLGAARSDMPVFFEARVQGKPVDPTDWLP